MNDSEFVVRSATNKTLPATARKAEQTQKAIVTTNENAEEVRASVASPAFPRQIPHQRNVEHPDVEFLWTQDFGKNFTPN
jgi:hypothetical protein